ncbi:STAS domain-containing protein [Sorangium sp. So ce131]|uniref:STAS domain-containing protein n=1 Tax=Sorangium sp. So ce131 TaxID=3133282 RepID=UPI003F610283
MGREEDEDRAELLRKLEALEREVGSLRDDARRWRALMKARDISVSLYRPDGRPRDVNPGWEKLWQAPAAAFLASSFNALEDQETERSGAMRYIERLFRGEEVALPPMFYDTRKVEVVADKAGVAHWICCYGVPVRDADERPRELVMFHFSVPEGATIQRKYEALFEEQQALRASLEARNLELERTVQLIEAQRDAIQAMSIPVIRVGDGVLCVPLVGMIDDARAGQLLERLLEAIAAQQAAEVLVDITGVPALDAQAAAQLLKAASAARLLGAACTIVGVSPSMAQTLVELGVDLGALTTAATLAEGLAQALARRDAKARASRRPGRRGSPGRAGETPL